jgi:hypothetical protein
MPEARYERRSTKACTTSTIKEIHVLKKTKRTVFGVFLAAFAVLAISGTAFAAHTVTPSENVTDGQQVTVSVTGLPANATAHVQQCNNDTGTDFDPVADCSFNGLRVLLLDASGAGTLTDFVVRQEPIGYADGDVDWKCDPTGAPDGSVSVAAPAGTARVYSVCRIRVVEAPFTEQNNQSFQNISFASGTEPEPVVPEAPLVVLLPLGGIALLGGAYFVLRGRNATAAV